MIAEDYVARSQDYEVDERPWGKLVWYVSATVGNARELTVGRCVIKPGQENPRHQHPNCEEVLHVLDGRIAHTLGGSTVEMTNGDTIRIPAGVLHNARNLGDGDALLMISFSSGDRQTVGEGT